jgi:hypothetical protein
MDAYVRIVVPQNELNRDPLKKRHARTQTKLRALQQAAATRLT